LQGRTLPLRDIYITTRLYADNKPLTPVYQTAYKSFRKASSSSAASSSSLSRDFNELIVFPIRLADLPLSSQVTFTVWDSKDVSEIEQEGEGDSSLGKIIGGSTMKLFGKKGTLKKASHRLYLWPNQAGDGSVETSTPNKVASEPNKKRDEMARLEKVRKALNS
jgi:phosphatidylinositol 3-kinase